MDIFLVENSAPIVKRLREMLAALPGVSVLGDAPGVRQAVREILRLKPQVVLLDLELEDGTGLDVLAALRGRVPGTDVYMLTNYVSAPMRVLAERLGAKGFYDKTEHFEQVRDLIAGRALGTGGGTEIS